MIKPYEASLHLNADDRLRRYLFAGKTVRVEVVTMVNTWQAIQARHAYPPIISSLLGELVAASALLSANLKFNGSLILQLHGDGPVKLIVVECQPGLALRATVKLREGAILPTEGGLQTLVNPGGQARFSIILDPAQRLPGQQPYQGIVPLVGETIADVLHHYMAQSEQLDTRLWLAADTERAAGLLLQRLPDISAQEQAAQVQQPLGDTSGINLAQLDLLSAEVDEDLWSRVSQLTATIKKTELLSLTPEEIIKRLYWQEVMAAFDSQYISYGCKCSREKVADVLRLLGAEEIESILIEQGKVTISCDYCVKTYIFDAVDCAQALNDKLGIEMSPSKTRH